MNALVIFSAILAVSQAGLIASPYAAGLPYTAGVYAAGYHPYAAPIAAAPIAAAPIAAAPAPYATPVAVAAPAPVAPVSSQYQAQDEFGNVNYGYSNINSAKVEAGNAYGGVTGSYSYVDAYGIPQRVDYIADALGFRVKATNLPVAPAAPQALALEAPVFDLEAPVFTGVAPEPVEETPEVQAARAEFQKAFDEAANRQKRSTPAATAPLALPYAAALPAGIPYAAAPLSYAAPAAPLAYAAPAAPLAYAAPAAPLAYAAPVAPIAAAPVATVAAAPAAREAILTKIQLNPGHAVAYRVD